MSQGDATMAQVELESERRKYSALSSRLDAYCARVVASVARLRRDAASSTSALSTSLSSSFASLDDSMSHTAASGIGGAAASVTSTGTSGQFDDALEMLESSASIVLRRLDSLMKQHVGLESQLSDREHTVNVLQRRQLELEESLRLHARDSSSSSSELRQRCEQLQHEAKTTRQRNRELEEELLDSSAQFEEVKSRCEQLLARLTAKDADSDRSEASGDSGASDDGSAAAQRSPRSARSVAVSSLIGLPAVDGAVPDSPTRRASHRARFPALLKTLDVAEAASHRLASRATAAATAHAAAAAAQQASTARQLELEAALRTLTLEHDSSRAAMDASRARLEESQRSLTEAEARAARLQQQLSAAAQDDRELAASVRTLKSTVAVLEAENATASQRADALRDKVQLLEVRSGCILLPWRRSSSDDVTVCLTMCRRMCSCHCSRIT
jgi:chromosome segregation ATPase